MLLPSLMPEIKVCNAEIKAVDLKRNL